MKKYLNYILLCFIIFLITIQYVIFAVLYYKNKDNFNKNTVDEFDSDILKENDNVSEINRFFVEIKGAVNKPGVYELTDTNIINDLVNAAEGFKKNAYTDNINLSKYLSSQMVVYVYTKYEYSMLNKNNNGQKECNCSDINLDSCLINGDSVINSSENTDDHSKNIQSEEESKKININTATLEQLKTLNGIGDAKAKLIIDYRNEHGIFNSIDDLKNISGISDKIFEKIKNNITI